MTISTTWDGGPLPGGSFSAPLRTTIAALFSLGSGTPTYTRATTAAVETFEGQIVQVLSNEARFQGARRVANTLLATEAINGASWTSTGAPIVTSGVTDPNGGTAAFTYTNTTGGVEGRYQAITTVVGHTYAGTWSVRRRTGTGSIYLRNINNVSVDITAVVTSSWQRFNTTTTATGTTGFSYILISTLGDAVDVAFPQIEDVTGQSNQNPSEYVSVGVLSAPYHGAGVDGVKNFNTLNGNTVASNVVTEATGAAIVAGAPGVAATAPVDANGPYGEYADPAQTDVLGTTDAIRRTMADAGWVASNVTKGTTTGVDGTTASAATLTASAGNGTVLYTTVLGAAIRTYSALVKRVTGTGTVNITGDNGVTWTAITLTSAWQPFYFTTASAANPVVGFRIVTNTDAIAVDFNTLVAGSNKFPLPTPVNVNQTATVLQYVSAGNVPTNNFTVYGEVIWPVIQPAGNYYLWSSYVDANNSTSVLWDGTNLVARRRIGGTSHDATIAFSPTANTRAKWAATFSSTAGTQIYLNGTAGTADATTTACQIGANFQVGADGNGANQPYASTPNDRIWATVLSSSQCAALTT